jgi:rod shape-determining protein MreD
MRWPAFAIAALLSLALQDTVGAVFRISLGGGLMLAVDFLAILAVLVALRTRAGSDALLAGWVLGLLIDLASPGMPIGLYALMFALAASLVYYIRSAVFTANPVTQMVMTFVFCLAAHGLARVFIHVVAPPAGARFVPDLVQALLLAISTAAVAPLIIGVVHKFDWLILPQRGQRRR